MSRTDNCWDSACVLIKREFPVCEGGGEGKGLRSRTSPARNQLRTTPVKAWESIVVEFLDAEYPIAYYAKRLAKNQSVIENYLVRYDFISAQAFLERFRTWNNAELRNMAGST